MPRPYTLMTAKPASKSLNREIVEAARLGQKAAVIDLVERGADVNASYRNYRPLHALIQENPHADGSAPEPERLACLNWLLDHGANPELLGAWPSARAMVIAAAVGQPRFVEALRSGGAVVDGFVASALGDTAVLGRAMKKDAQFAAARDHGGWTALHCAAASRLGKGDPATGRRILAICRMLLDAGADPRAPLRSWGHDVDPIYLAVAASHTDVVELLLAKGGDPNGALVASVWRNDIELAELALAQGAEIDAARDGDVPLLNQMVRWGQVQQTLWLLERGASPNVANARGWTAMHHAASRGNERMARALLAAGGDLTLRDQDGLAPADIAQRAKKSKLSDLFSRAP